MTASDQSAFDLISQYRFRIPLYQRHYAWQEPQCQALWQDFSRLALEDPPQSHHYLGTLVAESNAEGELLIVDGQQRLTSLMLLIHALQQHSGSKLLRNLVHEGDRLRLTPQDWGQGSDQQKFKALMEGSPATDNSDRLGANHAFFRNCAAGANLPDHQLVSGLQRLHFAFVQLDRNGRDRDEPQTIFEKMNAEGKALEVQDLIRNYVFMIAAETKEQVAQTGGEIDRQEERLRTVSAQQQNLYVNEWQNIEKVFPARALGRMNHFFRDYLIVKTGDYSHTSGPDLYQRFKVQAEVLTNQGTTAEELANDLWRHADAWGKVVFANPIAGTTEGIEKLRRSLQGFSLVAHAPYYPIATQMMLRFGTGDRADRLAEAFDDLTRFIAITSLTEAHTKPLSELWREVARLEHTGPMRNCLRSLWPSGFAPVEEVRRALDQSPAQGETEESNGGEPGDALQTQDMADGRDDGGSPVEGTQEEKPAPPSAYHANRRAMLFLLLKMNEAIMQDTGDTMMAFSEAGHSLEHIMPQTLDAPWKGLDPDFHHSHLHCIGNLTLVGKNYNSQISNRSLADKRWYYERSSYATTRGLAAELGEYPFAAPIKEWTTEMNDAFREFIKFRNKRLAEEAARLLAASFA